jgi:beta-galactosidase
MPHWYWPGKEGQDIDVRCFSNCEEVELFLNGHSLGKKKMPRNSHLQWLVKYAPGTLSATGYSDGKVVAQTQVETPGAAATVRLVPDRTTINADGEDLSLFTVSVTDAQGRVVPTAGNLIHFALRGPGKIIGVGNGDPACHEPDLYREQYPVHSQSLDAGWRLKGVPDVRHNLSEYGTNYDDSAWETADVKSDDGQLQEHKQAVFRTKFQVSPDDLAADAVKLDFEMIDDDGFIYVNGQRVGQARVQRMPAMFDIKPFLHAGENTLAVGVANDGGPGGIMEGVTLEFQYQPIPPHWQRSVFNGLAQVIVQSTQAAGEIKLTGTAENLSPAEGVIESVPAKLQARMP